MTLEQLHIEISLLINETLLQNKTINYQEYLQAKETLMNMLNEVS